MASIIRQAPDMRLHLNIETGFYNVEADVAGTSCWAVPDNSEMRGYNAEDDVAGIIHQALYFAARRTLLQSNLRQREVGAYTRPPQSPSPSHCVGYVGYVR